ncbi:MAG TPA: helix-turn-helix domain-containing protein [Pseudonocardiaceae bacterium]|nr:helix-turn-helix domain-containing protein [Pseudonocardiaceae bacterium]
MKERYEADRISDPKRLRALSHPLRLSLMNLLLEEGTATATRCAEMLSESVASCSYHLNLLAKYDFIEHAPGGQGREKPWRLLMAGQTISTDGLDLEGKLAAEAAIDTFLDHEFRLMKQRMRSYDREPKVWHDAIGTNTTTTFVTAEEAIAMRDEIYEILQRYRSRRDQPDTRPADTRPVRMMLAMTVAPDRPATAEPDPEADGEGEGEPA